MLWPLVVILLTLTRALAQGSPQISFPPQNFSPASIPLAIRHPYMSVWQRATNTNDPLSNAWPYFWGQKSTMGWAGKIRIDGQTYAWMGNDGVSDGPANVSYIQIMPTRTIYIMQAGPMNLTITFLSPIEPSDWVKQSIPFCYLSLEASSLDGNTHTVQVYSEISAEWVSGNRSSSITWSSKATSSSRYHEIVLRDADIQDFVEHRNQAQDAKVYYAMRSSTDLTWQINRDTPTRTAFRMQGRLSNVASTTFAPISPDYSVYAFATNLGQIRSTTTPVTWAVGILRDPSVLYTTPSGATEQRRPFYTSQYSGIGDLIDAVTGDFSVALERAKALDDRILSSAKKILPQYADLVSLATRQTMGSLDFTIVGSSSDRTDPSNVKIFMKDVGSSGRVNPVEKMFAAFPTYLYLNASIARGLLLPLLEWQDSPQAMDQAFASPDLGLTYPQATGTHGGDGTPGLEQTGNMLVMLYAHARFSGDGSLLKQYYNTTKRWADYLVNNSLTPTNQENADHENIANLTNLALKGIIGVKAMAEISRAVGQDSDGRQFDRSASELIGSWQSLAVASDKSHLLAIYGNQQSSTLMYNAYTDLLLGTKLIPQSILDLQTQYYSTQLSTAPRFGLPVDSTSGTGGSAAWTLLTSATASDARVRDSLIQMIWTRTSYNQTPSPATFFDTYDILTGVALGGTAGPALGAMYAHLALTIPNRTIDVTGGSNIGDGIGGGDTGGDDDGGNNGQNPFRKPRVGPIVGGVVGGLAAVTITAGACLYLRRKKCNRREFENEKADDAFNVPFSLSYHGASASSMVDSNQPVVVPDVEAPPRLMHAGPWGESDSEATHLSRSAFPSDTPMAGRPSKASEATPHVQRNHVPEDGLSESGTVESSEGPGTGTMPLTEMIGLRDEVENLRRVVREIRGDRFEPPPEYEA